MTDRLLLGQTLHFTGNPLVQAWEDVTHHTRQGGVLIAGDRIAAVGDGDALQAAHPRAEITHYGDALIHAGFVDAHMHYPQTRMIASWGKRLIDWLNTYTFPEESKFADRAYADAVAGDTLDLALANGTTTLTSFCTIHPESVDAFFNAAAARNMAVVAGKTCMDRNAPETLVDTAQTAYDESAALLSTWHGKGRASYAITPRFSPTSTPAQLSALGALWAEHPDCLMQTHLSEQTDEVAWVKELYPGARDYLDTYEAHGLLNAKGLYGHSIYLEDREIARLAEVGAAIAHCPTSNTFIGSGLCDVLGLTRAGVTVGLATDTGGGSSFSMLRTMAAAYEVGQLRGDVLHAAQLMWLATEGSAAALHMSGQIGRLQPGAMADIAVLDLSATPVIAQRVAKAEDFWDQLFPTIMLGDDRSVLDVWVAGQQVHQSA